MLQHDTITIIPLCRIQKIVAKDNVGRSTVVF